MGVAPLGELDAQSDHSVPDHQSLSGLENDLFDHPSSGLDEEEELPVLPGTGPYRKRKAAEAAAGTPSKRKRPAVRAKPKPKPKKAAATPAKRSKTTPVATLDRPVPAASPRYNTRGRGGKVQEKEAGTILVSSEGETDTENEDDTFMTGGAGPPGTEVMGFVGDMGDGEDNGVVDETE